MNDVETRMRARRGPSWKVEAAALMFGLALGGGWQAARAHASAPPASPTAAAHVTHDRDP